MLNFKKKLWVVNQVDKGILKISDIAKSQKISRWYVYELYDKYKKNGEESLKNKQRGRPRQTILKSTRNLVIAKRKQGYGIRRIEGLLDKDGFHISHNKIHRILKEANLVEPEPKKGRRYNYIRWERKHSNSLWQTDFCYISKLECWLCAWLDDHSRFITAAEYFTEATTDNVLNLFGKAAKKYSYPRETLSDRGTQFYANLGETCRFLEYMKSRGINHIYASLKKPTTCGKLERWWGTHNRERWNFSSLRTFLSYYNYKRPHMSLGWYTPYAVYMRDLR